MWNCIPNAASERPHTELPGSFAPLPPDNCTIHTLCAYDSLTQGQPQSISERIEQKVFAFFLKNEGNNKMLFLVSAPSRRKTDKVVIGYPDFPDSDSPLFFALIVDLEYGMKNRLAGHSCSVVFGIALTKESIKMSGYLCISPLKFTLGSIRISFVHILIKDAWERLFSLFRLLVKMRISR